MQEISLGMLMLHLLLTGSVEGKAAVQILKHIRSSVFLYTRGKQAIRSNTCKLISPTYFLIIMLLPDFLKMPSNYLKVYK